MSDYMPWSQRDLAVVRERFADMPTKELAEMLGRTPAAVGQKARKMGLVKNGNAGRFTKEHTPWNAGRKGWDAGGRSAETRFRPGSINGAAEERLQPLGTERLTKDGIWQRKIRMDGPPQRRWRGIHTLLWEEHNGPVPEGCIVVFRDGDRNNITIENLELISRAENMRRNSVHRLPKEWAEIVQLKGALQRQINKRVKA